MISHSQHHQEEQTHLQQNPTFLDGLLYCEEPHFDKDMKDFNFEEESQGLVALLSHHDLSWDDNELASLFSKEKDTLLGNGDLGSDGSLMVARKEDVEWMLRVNAYYGFTAMTAVLGVNYFDRFMSNAKLWVQRDKPWMSQLAAVACLSLAAKVEETNVPLLLDLQVEESKFVFESKTIQRMELLVLSTLQWKMNPATPLSFIDYIIRRFGLKTRIHWEFLRKCERLLLFVISESSFVRYSPSVIATATMLLVIKEVEHCSAMEYSDQLVGVLNISKEKVDDCYKLFVELIDSHGHKQSPTHIRKYRSRPGSPNGVIDAYFSSDSSNDSCAVALSVSSSPEPLYKKSRAQDQLMRLTPVNRVTVGLLSSPP